MFTLFAFGSDLMVTVVSRKSLWLLDLIEHVGVHLHVLLFRRHVWLHLICTSILLLEWMGLVHHLMLRLPLPKDLTESNSIGYVIHLRGIKLTRLDVRYQLRRYSHLSRAHLRAHLPFWISLLYGVDKNALSKHFLN